MHLRGQLESFGRHSPRSDQHCRNHSYGHPARLHRHSQSDIRHREFDRRCQNGQHHDVCRCFLDSYDIDPLDHRQLTLGNRQWHRDLYGRQLLGVVTRTGSILIGGQTFTVSQTGTDVNIAPTQSKGLQLGHRHGRGCRSFCHQLECHFQRKLDLGRRSWSQER